MRTIACLFLLAFLSFPFASAEIFMTSINYPQTYGAYTLGLPPSTVSSAAPFRSAVPVKKWATVTVLLPAADAKLWVNGRFLPGSGFARQFVTPELSASGSYLVRAVWGSNHDVETSVLVHPGKRAFVSFAIDPADAIMNGGRKQ